MGVLLRDPELGAGHWARAAARPGSFSTSFAVREAEKWWWSECGGKSVVLNKGNLLCVYANGKTQRRERQCRKEGTDGEACPRCGVVTGTGRRVEGAGGARGSSFCFFVDVGRGRQEHVRLGEE